jgi:hypothetical protein
MFHKRSIKFAAGVIDPAVLDSAPIKGGGGATSNASA